MGGNWIFYEAMKSTMSYTCQMGKAYHNRLITLLYTPLISLEINHLIESRETILAF